METKTTKTFGGFTEEKLREIAKGYSTKAEFYLSDNEVFWIIYDHCPQILDEVYGKVLPINRCTALGRLIILKRSLETHIAECDEDKDDIKGFIVGLVFTGYYPIKFMDLVESDDIIEAVWKLEAELVSINGDDTIVDEYFGC